MINGENIYLRMPELTDLEEIYKLTNTEENRDFFYFYRPMSKIDEENWIKSMNEEAKKNTAHAFVIVNKNTNEFLGVCKIIDINMINKFGTIGIRLKLNNQDKGIGTEAIKLLLKWGFETLNLNLIVIEAMENNERALHIYKDKLKFKYEGKLRNRFYKNGKYLDYHIFSITKQEYEEIYGEKE